MNILITAGPTHEPIDAVRYIANRSSGKMGAALAGAARRAGHAVTLIAGPVSVSLPPGITRIDVRTAAEMADAVAREFPRHDLLIMAAAVADYRPKMPFPGKLARKDSLHIELEPTPDIVASASAQKRPDQRTIGFSLEAAGGIGRAKQKLSQKKLDIIVFNPIETMNSDTIAAVLLYSDGREEDLGPRGKDEFADLLTDRSIALLI